MEPLGIPALALVAAFGLVAAAAGFGVGWRKGRAEAGPQGTGPGEPSTRIETVDPATGLAAGHRLGDHLAQRLADRSHNRGCGVLVCTPDRLSVLNRGLGFDVGDQVLRAMARRIEEVARADDAVFRWLGPQVVVVANQVPALRDLELAAQRILDATRGPVLLPTGDEHHLTVSIGIAAVFDGEPSAHEVLGDAVMARQRAEAAGGDQATLTQADDRTVARGRYELERDLRRAAERGELELFYQPVVELDTGRVAWLEALIRWRHPVRGLLHPATFLSSAIELGLSSTITDLAVSDACHHAHRWSELAGAQVGVSVNLDAASVASPALVAMVEHALGRSGLIPAQLALEVSGATLDTLSDRAWTNLAQLSALGVALVVDGLVGVEVPSWWPVSPQARKVDHRWLTARLTPVSDHRSPDASADGPLTVATGIEDQGELDAVRSLGVVHAQGFWLQRPVPATDLDQLVAGPASPPSLPVGASLADEAR